MMSDSRTPEPRRLAPELAHTAALRCQSLCTAAKLLALQVEDSGYEAAGFAALNTLLEVLETQAAELSRDLEP